MAKQRRQSKAAGRVLRALKLLRGAENVPDSSFEADRNSLWGLGRTHGKAANGRRKLQRAR